MIIYNPFWGNPKEAPPLHIKTIDPLIPVYASNSILPPIAVVFIVLVRSVMKRIK